MARRVILAGLMGWVVLMLWTFVTNGIFGFRSGIAMKRVPEERLVYDVLRKSILEPGGYVCNPAVTAERGFPFGEPVFAIRYGGVGHEAAGRLALIGLAIGLAAPLIGAWMLSVASDRFLSSYGRKVLFFAAIGLLFAIFADLQEYGIGGYPLRSALLLGAHDLAAWMLAGLVVAWRIRPARAEANR
ncbi:MAG: hypothetical protein ABIH26_07060 [Candidatus Eisenbacteria bacterium]